MKQEKHQNCGKKLLNEGNNLERLCCTRILLKNSNKNRRHLVYESEFNAKLVSKGGGKPSHTRLIKKQALFVIKRQAEQSRVYLELSKIIHFVLKNCVSEQQTVAFKRNKCFPFKYCKKTSKWLPIQCNTYTDIKILT